MDGPFFLLTPSTTMSVRIATSDRPVPVLAASLLKLLYSNFETFPFHQSYAQTSYGDGTSTSNSPSGLFRSFHWAYHVMKFSLEHASRLTG